MTVLHFSFMGFIITLANVNKQKLNAGINRRQLIKVKENNLVFLIGVDGTEHYPVVHA